MLNLNDYKSPKNEASLFKGIPIEERQNPKVRELMKTRLFSVKYRGKSKPNYQRDQSYIHKEFADTFAIYPYSGYPEYSDLVSQLFLVIENLDIKVSPLSLSKTKLLHNKKLIFLKKLVFQRDKGDTF